MSKQRKSAIVFGAFLLAVLLITGLIRIWFHDTPPPSFADFYLLAVLVLAYRYSWKLAAGLAGVSLLLAAWVLVPLDSTDRFELVSYAVCVTVVLSVVAALQRRRV